MAIIYRCRRKGSGGPEPVLITKSVTATTSSATYKATDESADGYSAVTVNPQEHSTIYTPSANTAQNDMGAVHNHRYVNTSGMIIPSGNKAISENGTGIDVKSYSTVSVSVPAPTLSGDAASANVLNGKTFYNTSTTKQTGSMTDRSGWTATGTMGSNTTIPKGYHDGTGYVYSPTVSLSGDAPNRYVLSGYTFYNSSTTKQSGSMTNNGAWQKTGTAGGYTYIPEGYHNGNGYVYSPSSSVTLSGNASASNVLSGKTFYSSSTTKQTGSMTNNGAWTKTGTAGSTVYIPEGYHNGNGYVTCPGANLSETQLWSNSSPSSDFAGNSISLSQSVSNFTYIKIVYAANKSEASSYNGIVIIPPSMLLNSGTKNYAEVNLGGQNSNGVKYARRITGASSTSITFGACGQVDSTTRANSHCIPLKVYGLK